MAVLSFSVQAADSRRIKNRLKLKFLLHYLIAKSLQVPCDFPLIKYMYVKMPGKRVLPFISACKTGFSASMTVEAAICLPMFLMFSAALMEPVKWLNRQRQIQTVLECCCEDMSQYYYGRKGDGSENEGEASEVLSETAAKLWIRGRLREYKDDVVIRNAEFENTQGDILVEAEYRETIPFFPAGKQGMIMHAASRRRIWKGIDGKLRGSSGSLREEENDGRIVYVGAGMGRYHLFRDCHYISNQYRSAYFEELSSMRNQDGRRYTACGKCGKREMEGGVVYITPSGEHFHTDKSCPAMISYVRSMPQREAEYLGLCSYCARRQGKEEKDGGVYE